MGILRQVLAPGLVAGIMILLRPDDLLAAVATCFLGGVISGRWIALASVPLAVLIAALLSLHY